jgi:lysophospholipase L1-like esterase
MKTLLLKQIAMVTCCVVASFSGLAQKKLLVLGSSTSACFGPDSYNACYLGRLQQHYQNIGAPFTIENRAIGGSNCYHGMPSGYVPPPGRDAPRLDHNITTGLQGNPDVVLINYPSNGYDVYSVDEVLFCLRTMKQAANNAGKPCYITTTQPRSDPEPYRTSAVKTKMAQIKERVLQEFGHYAINFWDGIVNPADFTILPEYNADGIHLNNNGHNILFNRVLEKNIFNQVVTPPPPTPPAPPPGEVNGLRYRYYEGDWNALPDFNALSPVKTGEAANIDLGARNRNDHYGFLWEGQLQVTIPGNYTFELVSDDGSKFFFNSYFSSHGSALVNNDGLHPQQSAYGSINIPAAGAYPVAIAFFEKDQGETMELYWSGPGIPRQRIPNSAFGKNSSPGYGELQYRYYEGDWNSLPDFNVLSPVKQGSTSNIDLGARNRDNHFGFLWEGQITLPQPGNYTFELVSDDGSKLYFNSHYSPGANALVHNDGLHPAQSASGTTYVPAAGSYPVALTFFEKDGDNLMEVYWSGPGIPRQRIPASAFSTSAYAQNEGLAPVIEVAEELPGLSIQAYPNPFSERINISFFNPGKAGNIHVELFDIAEKRSWGRISGTCRTVIHYSRFILEKETC